MKKKKVVDKMTLVIYQAYTPDGTCWVETPSLNEFLNQCKKWDRKQGELKTLMVKQMRVTFAPKTKKVSLLGKKCRNCGHPSSDHNMHDPQGDAFCAPYHTHCDCEMYTRVKKDA